MNEYMLLVLHKLEGSFGYYDVQTGQQLALIKTRPYPHEICLDQAREKIYIAEMGVRGIESEGPGGHTIAVFDIRSGQRTGEIDTGSYDRPHGVATFGSRLYVTSESTKHLLVYDLDTERLVRAVYLDQDCAHMVSIAPDGETAYTANIGSDSITAVSTAQNRVLYHIPVPKRPEGMVFSPDGNHIGNAVFGRGGQIDDTAAQHLLDFGCADRYSRELDLLCMPGGQGSGSGGL